MVRQRFWSNPVTLRKDLTEFAGEVESPTQPEDALPVFRLPRREIASGVVPRIDLPGGLRPLLLQINDSQFPAFAKLRMEAAGSLLGDEGQGSLYLGVYLDPIYRVHWNNRAGKVVVQIKVADGMQVSEAELAGPVVEEDADIDPRMFLVNLDRGDNTDDPLEVTVTYTVCDDDETFCHTISQSYTVEFQSDRELGSRPGVFMPGMFARVAALDLNRDGKIEGAEFPPNQATLYLSHMDTNLDNVIDSEEIQDVHAAVQ